MPDQYQNKIVLNIDHNIVVNPGENIHIGSANRRCPNIKKMKNLGYNPKVNIDQGIKKTIKWY